MKADLRALRALATLGLVFAVAAGCGVDEYYTGLGDGALEGEPLHPETQAAKDCPDCSCDCECTGGTTEPPAGCDQITFGVDDLATFAWRFTSLEITQPLPEVLLDMLNEALATDLEAGTLNIVLVVDTDDRPTCALTGRLGGAEVVGDDFAFAGDPSPITLSLYDSGFETADPSLLSFPYAILEPPAIPLQSVLLSGDLGGGATTITNGGLDAALSKADADTIVALGSSLGELLSDIPLDRDLDDNGTMDAWGFKGIFSAEQVTVVD